MKYSAIALSTILAGACARPEANNVGRAHARDLHVARHAYIRPVWNDQLQRREVPQEHSHEKFLTKTGQMLNLNNPAGIKDPVFGLLGNAAGAAGQGTITNTGKSFVASRAVLLTMKTASNKLRPTKHSPTPKLPETLMV